MADNSAVVAMLNSVPDTDVIKGMIGQLLNTDTQTPLMNALSVFSVNLLAIATAMVAWHTFMGIVSSAHTGRFLGGKWHAIWAPVRVSIGIAMLVPAINGATFGQLIVREVAYMSNAMASTVWQSYASQTLDAPSSLPTINDAGGLRLAVDAVKREFCVQGVRALMPSGGGSNLTPLNTSTQIVANGQVLVQWPSSPSVTANTGKTTSTFDFGYSCGSISVPTIDTTGDYSAAAKTWQKAQIQDVANVLSAVSSAGIGTKFVQASLPGATSKPPTASQVRSAISAIANSYNAAQRAAAEAYTKAQYATSTGKLKESMKAEGWLSAGVYWRQLSEYSKSYMEAVPGAFTSVAPDSSQLGADINRDYQPMSKDFYLLVDGIFPDPNTPDMNQVASAVNADARNNISNANGAPSSSFFDSWMTKVTNVSHWATQQFADRVTSSSADPVGDMVNFGHDLIMVASGIVASLAVLAVGTGNVISSMAGGQTVFAVVSHYAFLISEFVGGVGVLYAYILPMLPFMYLIFMALGWMVMIIESIIAVIIWAFLFVRMDGDELVDNPQRQGVLILFNLLLRPTLGVLALALAMTLLPIFLNAVNKLIVPGFFAAQGTSTVALIGCLASMGIIAYVHWQLMTRTLALITDLPDRVTRWFGLPGENLGEGHGVSTAAAAFGGAALGAGRQATKGAYHTTDVAANAMRGLRDRADADPVATGEASDGRAPRGDGD